MDVERIDQQYAQLQIASQQVYQELERFGRESCKLNRGAESGRPANGFLDLKEITLAVQSQQQQTANLPQMAWDLA